LTDRRYPPFTQLGMLSLALIVTGGIYLSSYIPQHVPLGPAVALLVASIVVMAVNMALLTRVPDFAWPRFIQVGKWALLAYAISAGMIEYVFLRNHLRGGALVILTLSLIVYALEVPTLIAFTVARWDNTSGELATD
jgi:hypothetical protein